MANKATMVLRAKKNGIVNPIYAYNEAQRAGIPYAVLCAILEQETSGGHNVFGHDPTIFVGAGTVTKEKYLAYKAKRGSHGQGGMQGVGPLQLTWYSYQDKADTYGGCWNVKFNLRVGAEMLRDELKQYKDWWTVFWHYNGSQTYANEVEAKVKKWQQILK